jgi:hypothetical protein
MQKRQEFNGLESSVDGSHRIDKGRIRPVWPSGGFIKGRNAADFHAFAVQLAQRVLQRRGRLASWTRQIGA